MHLCDLQDAFALLLHPSAHAADTERIFIAAYTSDGSGVVSVAHPSTTSCLPAGAPMGEFLGSADLQWSCATIQQWQAVMAAQGWSWCPSLPLRVSKLGGQDTRTLQAQSGGGAVLGRQLLLQLVHDRIGVHAYIGVRVHLLSLTTE